MFSELVCTFQPGVLAKNEYCCAHGTQINFGDLTPYLTYGSSSRSVLMSRDWLAGRWAPARCQLGTLTRAGYAFPPGTPLRASKTKRMRPEQRFVREQFPGFQPGRWVGDHFIPIPWPEVSAMQD
jgi:hypothetical protein